MNGMELNKTTHKTNINNKFILINKFNKLHFIYNKNDQTFLIGVYKISQ